LRPGGAFLAKLKEQRAFDWLGRLHGRRSLPDVPQKADVRPPATGRKQGRRMPSLLTVGGPGCGTVSAQATVRA